MGGMPLEKRRPGPIKPGLLTTKCVGRLPAPATSSPSRAWLFRQQRPFLGRYEAAAQKGFAPLQQLLVIQRRRQTAPSRAGARYPEDAFHT